MSDQNIFSEGTPTQSTESITEPAATPAGQDSSVPNPVDHLLSGIKNEQGEVKYNSVEEALKGAAHAQNKITQDAVELERLRTELAATREENAKYKGALEAMEKTTPAQQPTQDSIPANPAGLDEEGVMALIAEREQKAVAQANTSKVVSSLKEKYGDKAQEVFYSTAKSLGLSPEIMNGIAAASPEAALKYFSDVSAPNINPTQTSVNTAAITPPAPDLNAPLARSETSMLIGATSKDLKQEMERHKQRVYEKFGVTA